MDMHMHIIDTLELLEIVQKQEMALVLGGLAPQKQLQSKFGGKGSPRLWCEHTNDNGTALVLKTPPLISPLRAICCHVVRMSLWLLLVVQNQSQIMLKSKKKTTKMSCCRGKTKMRIKKCKTRPLYCPCFHARQKKKCHSPRRKHLGQLMTNKNLRCFAKKEMRSKKRVDKCVQSE